MIAESGRSGKAHLILMDIGNTNVAMASWFDDHRDEAEHIPTVSFDQLMNRLERLWNELPGTATRAVVICSVCPPVLAKLRQACAAKGIKPLLVVGEEIESPIPLDLALREPSRVGTDRLCAAAGAFARVRGACVVADFGTALTIDLVADNGIFLGGTILPGVALSARALHEHTAQLPLVEVGCPTETLGKDTQSAIRNGIYAMMVGALREIAERYATDIGKWPPLVITGGNAPDIARGADFVDKVMPDLCLDGLVIAYKQHAGTDEDQPGVCR
ncbi:MAG TPA: type III pantothenate kinase [Phycisphaerae bacterium]|nr:type III pantothenate kinase [Phycisphaerae bacterium]HRR83791.1 type III pantothenate kinase [Phycisphaerae bacterium]